MIFVLAQIILPACGLFVCVHYVVLYRKVDKLKATIRKFEYQRDLRIAQTQRRSVARPGTTSSARVHKADIRAETPSMRPDTIGE